MVSYIYQLLLLLHLEHHLASLKKRNEKKKVTSCDIGHILLGLIHSRSIINKNVIFESHTPRYISTAFTTYYVVMPSFYFYYYNKLYIPNFKKVCFSLTFFKVCFFFNKKLFPDLVK